MFDTRGPARMAPTLAGEDAAGERSLLGGELLADDLDPAGVIARLAESQRQAATHEPAEGAGHGRGEHVGERPHADRDREPDPAPDPSRRNARRAAARRYRSSGTRRRSRATCSLLRPYSFWDGQRHEREGLAVDIGDRRGGEQHPADPPPPFGPSHYREPHAWPGVTAEPCGGSGDGMAASRRRMCRP